MSLSIPSWSCALLLFILAGCGDGGDGAPETTPEAPSDVHVAHNTRPVIISWRHDGSNALAYVIYRGVRDASDPPVEVGREPVSANKKIYTFRYAEPSDDTRYRYGVAATGVRQLSAITWNDESKPLVAATSCQVHDISADDLDGDGIPNGEEYEGWQILVAPLTASAVGVAGQLQRDKPIEKNVSSSMFYADTDGDGLCDLQEHAQAGTDPSNVDTDEDGLDDYAEVITWNSNPSDPDSDDDAFAPVLAVINGEQQVQYVTLASADPALLDGRETCASSSFPCNFKTSPTLADTDGDSYTDYDEIIQMGSQFNPLVANLPQLELSLVGTAGLTVDIAYSDSTKQAQSKSTSLSASQSDANTNYNSTVRKTWDKFGQSVSAGYKGGLTPSWSVNVTASFEEGVANTSTSGWSGTTTNQSGQTYNDAVQTASQSGRQISGGSISMGVQIKNTGQISYNLTDLAVTALQHLPEQNSFSSVATLQLANPLGADLSFGGIGTQLLATGNGISLAPGEATGVLQVKADLAAGNKILDLMANPASLYFDIGTFGITNAQNIDFNFIDQITNAQTGLVLIDFGGGSVISKRLATNVGRVNGQIAGVTLGDIMNTLGIKYTTGAQTVNNQTITVLTGVQDPGTGDMISVDSTNNRFWVALKTAELFAPLPQNFEDIVLQAGGAIYLLYVTDADRDDIYLRDEKLHGTSDANVDSDGDGLGDFAEIATGWQVAATLPPRYPVQVFSNPTVPDADNDGLSDAQEKALGTDPNSPDTDGDLLCDGGGSAANAGGICRVGVKPDPQPLVPQFSFIGSSPAPYVFTAAADAPIVVNFSLPVRGTSTIKVRSLTRGPVQGTSVFSNGGRTLTFTPQQPFMANEVIDVSLIGETSADSGAALPDYHYDFRIASPATSSGFDYPPEFQTPLSTDPDFRINAVVSGDFNQDNLLDIAMTGSTSNSGDSGVYVAFGSGASDFSSPIRVSLSFGPQALAAGDFNNDGRPDLAVTMVQDASVVVLLAGTTQGQFDPPTAFSYLPVGRAPLGIATGDLNGDGNLDLVTVNNDDPSANTILLGKGDGRFIAGHPLVSGAAPRTVAVADIDGDGFLDIITPFGSPGTGGISISLGNGDGTFRPTGIAQPFTAAGFPVAIATGDFNGDGLLDFVTANQGSDDVSMFINNGNGSFTPQANLPVVPNPTAIVAGDFNGDGKLDIALSAAPQNGPMVAATVLYGQGTVDNFERNDQQNLALRGTALVIDAFQLTPASAPLELVVLGFDSSGSRVALFSATPP